MIEYIKGKIVEINPTEVILEANCIGYKILISLQTYEILNNTSECTVYIHHYLREDDEQLYGFANKDERELFRLLISVSGIGLATARMMLSSLTCDDIRSAILSEDLNKIKSIKGIGLKTAQRLILELKDKIHKGEGKEEINIFEKSSNNKYLEEATIALINLGFTKANINKVLNNYIKQNPNTNLEQLIKYGLQNL